MQKSSQSQEAKIRFPICSYSKINQKHMGDAKDGWSVCNALYTTKARRDTKPIEKGC